MHKACTYVVFVKKNGSSKCLGFRELIMRENRSMAKFKIDVLKEEIAS